MRLEFSSIQPVHPPDRSVPTWEGLSRLLTPPPSKPEPPVYPPTETVLSATTLKAALVDIGVALSPANLALAEALAKLGVPLTDLNMSEGQAVLARLPGVSASVYALSKALDLSPTPAIMRALSAVVDQSAFKDHLDLDTLDLLSLLPQPASESGLLTLYLTKMIEKFAQSTENKLLTEPDEVSISSAYDARSALLDLAQTSIPGHSSTAADRQASFIEGQQLLNQVATLKFDTTAPLYFAFPLTLAAREATCELQVWSSSEQKSTDALSADKEEYLRATVRVDAERIGMVETSLIGMWSGRLCCTMSANRPSIQRLLKRESTALRQSLSALGWSVAPIEVTKQDRYTPLWLGGDLLENPRSRVDKRI